MGGASNTNHLYSDLAWLWPMWGDHEKEYAHYSDHVVRLIQKYASYPIRSLLDISCGGGKNAYNLKRHFLITGLDLSPAMLNLAITLNPECEFIEGDMRRFSLGRTFDSILMDDGISHMASRADLAAAFASAFHHLRASGVMVVTPDITSESFSQNKTTIAHGVDRLKPKDVDILFVENVYDPDPSDERYEATLVYLIRKKGRLRVESDRFTLGLFSLDTWQQMLSNAGFIVNQEKYEDGECEYVSFACVKPR
jgi:SAM-dependent methyltransferase